MSSGTAFAARATTHSRDLIQALHVCFDDLEEYAAMGGSSFSVPYGDFTEAQIDNLMGAISTLKATFDANQGYFYEGAS